MSSSINLIVERKLSRDIQHDNIFQIKFVFSITYVYASYCILRVRTLRLTNSFHRYRIYRRHVPSVDNFYQEKRNTDGCAEKVYECARCLFFLKYVARRKESAVSASFNSLTFLFLHLIQFYSQNSIMYFYSQSCVDSNEIYRARNDIVRHYRLNKCNITI